MNPCLVYMSSYVTAKFSEESQKAIKEIFHA